MAAYASIAISKEWRVFKIASLDGLATFRYSLASAEKAVQ